MKNQKVYKSEKLNNGNQKKTGKFFWLVFVIAVGAICFWFGFQKGKSKIYIPKNPELLLQSLNTSQKIEMEEADFSLFWQVWDILKEKHIDSENLQPKKILYNSIKGMLWTAKDPYTVFMDPGENQSFNEDIKGTFEGIGAEIGIKQGILTIIAPLDGSPAQQAGLRAGDKIIKINDESTAEMNINDSVKKIRGESGTEVKLTIFRNDDVNETKEIIVKRGIIKVESVTKKIIENSIVYFKISRFGENTAREFKVLSKKMPANTNGIIIDLRNNPGGYLDVTVDLASMLLPRNETVVIEENKNGKQSKLITKGGDKFSNIETVVLINEGSASASEILAGALRENRKNVAVVGATSFGKGSVQEFIELPNKTAVKITVAKWLTPKGNQINEKGINPDIKIDLTDDDYENNRDPQLDEALKILNKKTSR